MEGVRDLLPSDADCLPTDCLPGELPGELSLAFFTLSAAGREVLRLRGMTPELTGGAEEQERAGQDYPGAQAAD